MAAGNRHIPLTLPIWYLTEVTPEHGLAVNDKDHLDSIIWVGASTPEDKKWPWSAYGPNVDLFAPGEFIQSARNDSDTSSLAEGGIRGGTSDVSQVDIGNKETLIATNYTQPTTSYAQAAPRVTGIIACLLSHPRYRNLPPREMKVKIKAMALPTAMKLRQAECEYFFKPTLLCRLANRRWLVDVGTITRLASCRIDRWTVGDPPEEEEEAV